MSPRRKKLRVEMDPETCDINFQCMTCQVPLVPRLGMLLHGCVTIQPERVEDPGYVRIDLSCPLCAGTFTLVFGNEEPGGDVKMLFCTTEQADA